MKLKTNMVQKVNQKFIFSFLLTDVIKENGDFKRIFETKNGRMIMQSKCAVCGIKKSRFVKEQEEKGLQSNLGIKTPLSKIPLLNLLFLIQFH